MRIGRYETEWNEIDESRWGESYWVPEVWEGRKRQKNLPGNFV